MSFEESQWSHVIIEPSLWWRIKALFKRPTIIFAWGEDRYTLRGFAGEMRWSCGGVPSSVRADLQRAEYVNDAATDGSHHTTKEK